jgi:hypothetical protein
VGLIEFDEIISTAWAVGKSDFQHRPATNITIQEITLKINDILVKMTIENARKLKALLEKLLEHGG